MREAAKRRPEVLRDPPFAFFWGATTLRAFGGAVAGVGFQVLIVTVLHASPGEIGVLTALGVVPYLFLGLIIGALMDRWRRQRTLMVTTLGRAVVLGAVPVLILTGALNFWTMAAVSLALGVLTLFSDSAAQPLVPRIVPRASLVVANARVGQSNTVAETAGPALGGLLLSVIGPSWLFALDGLVNVVAAVLQSRIRVHEPRPARREAGRHVGHDIAGGVRFTYRHRTLRPLALSVHVWFLGNSIVTTTFGVYALRHLGLPDWGFGLVLAAGGVGGFLGALLAPRLGAVLGAGRAILCGRALIVLPWLALALLPLSATMDLRLGLPVAAGALFLSSLAMGIEDTNDISYRQAIAPDEIQGRMNATIRTANRVVFFFGALATGVLMTLLGFAATIGIGALVFILAAAIVLFSPLRTVRHEDETDR